MHNILFAIKEVGLDKELLVVAADNLLSVGGNAADSEHIVGELMKSFILPHPLNEALKHRLIKVDPALSTHIAAHLQQNISAIYLNSHTALISTFANNVKSALSYTQQIISYNNKKALF